MTHLWPKRRRRHGFSILETRGLSSLLLLCIIFTLINPIFSQKLGPMASSSSGSRNILPLDELQEISTNTISHAGRVVSKTTSAVLPTDPARVVSLDSISEQDLRDVADRAMSLINLARRRKGLNQLCVNSKLSNSALEHTTAMVDLDVLALGGLVNGSTTYIDRIQAIWGNWTWAGRAVARSNLIPLVNQNLLLSSKMVFMNRNRKLITQMPLAGVPEVLVASWLASPNHASLLLTPHFRHMGMTVEISSTLQMYWTLDLVGGYPVSSRVCSGVQPFVDREENLISPTLFRTDIYCVGLMETRDVVEQADPVATVLAALGQPPVLTRTRIQDTKTSSRTRSSWKASRSSTSQSKSKPTSYQFSLDKDKTRVIAGTSRLPDGIVKTTPPLVTVKSSTTSRTTLRTTFTSRIVQTKSIDLASKPSTNPILALLPNGIPSWVPSWALSCFADLVDDSNIDKSTFKSGLSDCLSDALVAFQETAPTSDPLANVDPTTTVNNWIKLLIPKDKRYFKRLSPRVAPRIMPRLTPRQSSITRIIIAHLQCSLPDVYYRESSVDDLDSKKNSTTSQLVSFFVKGISPINYSMVSGVAGSSASSSRTQTLSVVEGEEVAGLATGNTPKPGNDNGLMGLAQPGLPLSRNAHL